MLSTKPISCIPKSATCWHGFIKDKARCWQKFALCYTWSMACVTWYYRLLTAVRLCFSVSGNMDATFCSFQGTKGLYIHNEKLCFTQWDITMEALYSISLLSDVNIGGAITKKRWKLQTSKKRRIYGPHILWTPAFKAYSAFLLDIPDHPCVPFWLHKTFIPTNHFIDLYIKLCTFWYKSSLGSGSGR